MSENTDNNPFIALKIFLELDEKEIRKRMKQRIKEKNEALKKAIDQKMI